ncbi:MAG: queuosine precursor transporter [bacterium]|nr:queuosine precursor transporter [bacterium]
MSLTVILLWAVGVTSVTLVGSTYVRRYDRPDLLIALYVAFVLTAQMLATKIASFDLGFAHFSGPAGVLVFSVTYLLLDIMNEKFGRKEAQHMIFLAFVAQVAMAFFLWLGTQFTPDPFWASNSDSWNKFFGLVPRITLASWIAFLISENVDAYVFSWFKKLTHDRHLWMRNAFSSIPALALDSLIFVPLAFYGTPGFPILAVIKGQIVVKWLVGVISVPFMYLNHALITRGKGGAVSGV